MRADYPHRPDPVPALEDRIATLEQRIASLEFAADQLRRNLQVLAGMDRPVTAYDLLEALR